MRRGFYSLLQYCPDPARAEVANVGVVVVDIEAGSASIQVSRSPSNVRRVFGAQALDSASLSIVLGMYVQRLGRELQAAPRAETVDAFVRKEPNEITMTRPRGCVFDSAAAEALRLRVELVDDRAPTPRGHRTITALRTMADELTREGVRVERVREVMVPVMDTPIRPDFVFTNGCPNVVKGHVFQPGANVANACSVLGTAALMLSQHPSEIGDVRVDTAKLVLVCEFSNKDQASQAKEILRAHAVETFTVDQLPALREKVRTTAH